MKILHAITRLDKGGSSTNTLLSVLGLARMGYDVDLLYGKTNGADERLIERAKKAGVKFIEQRSLLRDIHPWKDMVALFDAISVLRKGKYDLLHAHSSKAGLIYRIAAKLTGIERIVYTPHGHVFYGYFDSPMTKAIIIAERLLAKITDKMIGLTDSECEEWIDFGVGKEIQYESIPSGIEFESLSSGVDGDLDFREKYKISKDKKLIGSIGRFVPIKGFKYFIEAGLEQLKSREDVEFVLVGDGQLRDQYINAISQEGLTGRFHIIPWQNEPSVVLKALDIFVLPSINEGMGRVLLEAMYFSKPVIATKVGGVPGVVSEEEGFLVNPRSSEDICAAINQFLEDPDLCRIMGEKGREKAISKFSSDVMVQKLDILYKNLLQERS